MTAYYNEIDPFAAAWLRELIKAGHIAPGDVDERSIEDVRPSEVVGYTQCHFFAGIGGWSYALRMAGWADNRPVWTGSCPCQPFSTAGKRGGTADERHLWPSWFHLISQCRPPVVFGEQVEAAIKQGWLDLVQDDLEGIGYAVEPHGMAACNLGAPHIRKRLWFVADSTGNGWREERSDVGRGVERDSPEGIAAGLKSGGVHGELADSPDVRREQRRDSPSTPLQRERSERSREHARPEQDGELSRGLEGLRGIGAGTLADSPHKCLDRCGDTGSAGRGESSDGRGLVNPTSEQMGVPECSRESRGAGGKLADSNGRDTSSEGIQCCWEYRQQSEDSGVNFWDACDWLPCIDGKSRPVEPGTFPLAYGVSNRVGKLRGYGNAIVPQVAAAFIEAYEEVR